MADLPGLPPAPSNRLPALPTAVGAIPGLVRFSVSASVRTARWSAGATIRTTSFIVRTAVSGESPGTVVDEALDQLRNAIGVAARAPGAIVATVPAAAAISDQARGRGDVDGHGQTVTLPQMFHALLDASADVNFHYEGHPAYYRLLTELAPDEARILRLFAQQGPQPAMDVRTKRLFGVGSRLLAPGITMIGSYAGLVEQDRVPAYLNNLNRLGLIWFSREMLANEEVYHLLEAQPEVLEAFKGQKVDTVLRSIELTAFGKNFCALCGLTGPEGVNARATLGEVTQALPPPDGR